MKKKNVRKARIISMELNSKEWERYQTIANFIERLDRLPDAAEVRKNKLRSVPLPMLDMVF